jgi:hypothetical protein
VSWWIVEFLFYEIDVWMYTIGVREIYCIAVYISEYVAVGRLSTFIPWNYSSIRAQILGSLRGGFQSCKYYWSVVVLLCIGKCAQALHSLYFRNIHGSARRPALTWYIHGQIIFSFSLRESISTSECTVHATLLCQIFQTCSNHDRYELHWLFTLCIKCVCAGTTKNIKSMLKNV